MNSDLVVRLPNHLGDACMALPALRLLGSRGLALTLAGRAWAADLFAALPWPVLKLAGERSARVAALRRQLRPGTPALLLTNSLGSALEARLARLRPAGYRTDGRRVLLARSFPVPARWRGAETPMHMVEYYYELAREFVGGEAPPEPQELALPLAPAAVGRAGAALRAAGIAGEYVMLCPVAVGTHRGKVKAWHGFGALCAALAGAGIRFVACPGPGEREAVRAAVPGATLLPETDVGTFAALLAAWSSCSASQTRGAPARGRCAPIASVASTAGRASTRSSRRSNAGWGGRDAAARAAAPRPGHRAALPGRRAAGCWPRRWPAR
ncbi:MAG: heptosyltransferase [Burkholderiaceae bacterium]|nr:heptosyltransferase [Burkholderiaceae bacterium]